MASTPSRTLRGDVIPQDAPIVFDILSIDDDTTNLQKDLEEKTEQRREFSVRFLGCMRVNVDTGQTVVFEVMRRILAARAIHDMFTTTHLHLTVTPSFLTLRDPTSSVVRLQHKLKDVAFWAVHSENQRLVGYIVRQGDSSSSSSEGGGGGGVFSCYVFESDENGKEICSTLGAAARQAYAHLLDQKTSEERRKQETRLLLDNIAKLPDKNAPPEISADGHYLVLEDESGREVDLEVVEKPKVCEVIVGKKPESDA